MRRHEKKFIGKGWVRSQRIILYRFKRCCVLMLFYPVLMHMVLAQATATNHPVVVNCDVHHGACIQTVATVEVAFDIRPKPVKAMTDLTFKITLEGEQPKAPPYIDLGMPGMKMGPNRVLLQSTAKGVYEGSGIIVRCPSGKRIWRAKIILPDMGEAEFVFDVIY